MFIRINSSLKLLRADLIHSIVPLFTLKNLYSINFESPETGTSAEVIVTPELKIQVQLNTIDGDAVASEIIADSSTVLDNKHIPLLSCPAFTEMPTDAPEDKKFIASQKQFNQAIGRYSTKLHELNVLRNQVPYINIMQQTVEGEGAQAQVGS